MRVEYSSSIALVSYIVWATIYGYFALRFDSDPETCIADDRDVRATGASTGTDVGDRFRTCFEWLFYLSLTLMTISLSMACCKSDSIRKCLGTVGIVAQWGLTGLVLFLFISRLRHSGQVCSGDFLGEHDSTDGYLIQQGLFIKVVFFLFIGSLIICTTCVCMGLAFFGAKKRTQGN